MVIEVLLMYIKVFVVGGLICTIAQVLINYTKITAGKILVYFLLAGVFLQAIGVYQYVVDFAGAGATVPIIGFGYSLCKGVIKGINQKGIMGIFLGGITATSGGICAAILFGYVAALISKPKIK